MIFSSLEETLSCSYSITSTSFDTVSDLRGRPTGRLEGYSAGRIDLEPLENPEPEYAFGYLRCSSSTAFSERELLKFILGAGTEAGFALPTTKAEL